MIEIISAENRIIKHIRKLSGHLWRAKSGETVLEGERIVNDSVAYGAKLEAVLVREDYTGRIPACDRIYKVKTGIFDAVAETKTPQGIMAVCKATYESVEALARGNLIILCDRIQDPGNLGTIFRTAHAVGADGVVLIKGCTDPFAPKTVRSSMGSVFALPIALADDFPTLPGYTTFCGMLSEKAVPLYGASFPKATMLVLGNEAGGVSRSIYEKADKHILIPMPGGAESLNVAAAGAVMMYEYYRQVHYV
ncbi:MAG: RNA methyltransferase [Ruminococcaceae bacterium]|nr:RNA methyltransferase [Oscillospiraceae bacterium]